MAESLTYIIKAAGVRYSHEQSTTSQIFVGRETYRQPEQIVCTWGMCSGEGGGGWEINVLIFVSITTGHEHLSQYNNQYKDAWVEGKCC